VPIRQTAIGILDGLGFQAKVASGVRTSRRRSRLDDPAIDVEPDLPVQVLRDRDVVISLAASTRTRYIRGISPSCIIIPAASGWLLNSTIFPSRTWAK
jgi:hypothetical protein